MHRRKGFRYKLDWERIEEYRKLPIARRLKWLYYGNLLRKSLPANTIEIQERFRKAQW
jgi:hypothetical protein